MILLATGCDLHTYVYAQHVLGKARVVGCRPLSEQQWEATQHMHLGPGTRLYGAKSHAWAFDEVEHVAPIHIVHKRGAID